MTRLLPVLGLLLLSACAARSPRYPGPLGPVGRGAPARPPAAAPIVAPEPPEAIPETLPPSDFSASVVAAADYYLRHRPQRDDCSGYVCAVFTRAGLPLSGNSESMWEQAKAEGLVHRRKIPQVGDLAFFDNTYDRNRNGRYDDPLSHVAVVLAVEPDGTIRLGHGGTSRGRTTMVMNLRAPDVHELDGKELNSWLRRKERGDPKSWRYLSGELWRGFATLEPTDGATLVDTAAR